MTSYTDNSSNELTSNASFTYDSDGNMMSKTLAGGTTNDSWDFENRMTSVALPGSGGTVSFKYDPLGPRIYKSSSSATSIFVYDLMARKANCCARSSPLQAQKRQKSRMVGERGFQAPTPLVPNQILEICGCKNLLGIKGHSTTQSIALWNIGGATARRNSPMICWAVHNFMARCRNLLRTSILG